MAASSLDVVSSRAVGEEVALLDDTIYALGALGDGLPDNLAVIAETELRLAIAHNSTLVGACSAASGWWRGRSGNWTRGSGTSDGDESLDRGCHNWWQRSLSGLGWRRSGGRYNDRRLDDSGGCCGRRNNDRGGGVRGVAIARWVRSSTTAKRLEGTGSTASDVFPGVLESVVGRLSGLACALGGDVGNSHIGKCLESSRILGATADIDVGAVHVHLPVADLVEPSPSQSKLTGGKLGGNSEWELAGTVGTVGKVASSRSWAAALERVDDLPH